MSKRFEDQVAIVTGAATGLGLQIAQRLASEGAKVALFDRDASRIESAVSSIKSPNARGYSVDIAQTASVASAVSKVEKELGTIAVMVNSAGIVGPTNTKIVDYPPEKFEEVCRGNLLGSFIMTQAVLPSMLRHKYGRILLIASIAGKEGNPGMVAYSASKSGVIGLVKGVAKEYAETGITVNGLAPAVIMTDMVRGIDPAQVQYMTSKIPMKRLGTLDEVAAIAAWIASRECSFTTGFIFDLSGGRATY
jgi:NAD(P)-dependent dehydrogenase (short-subunit alcohol dehydrogenase family)